MNDATTVETRVFFAEKASAAPHRIQDSGSVAEDKPCL